MTPQESARREEQRERSLANRENTILTFREWCAANSFSEATGHRIRKSGTGPRFVKLSARRIGVTVRDNVAWQESRATT